MSGDFSHSAAIVVPGYGGTTEQPIVRATVARLTGDGLAAVPIAFSRKKPTEPFAQELHELRQARAAIEQAGTRVVLVGRSFGGRMCARLAAQDPPTALVLLGHPIAPEGRPRPDDEAALEAVRCPTLVVQGDRDRLGPLDVLRRIAGVNQNVAIYVLKGVGHNFGPRQSEGIEHASAWLRAILST
jgi:predicted alpha/beta-hydrolase family hydrolase